jgi:hypothetical protein
MGETKSPWDIQQRPGSMAQKTQFLPENWDASIHHLELASDSS